MTVRNHQMINLRLRVPGGQAAIWECMRQLPPGFLVEAVAEASGIGVPVVRDYVRKLERDGHLAVIDSKGRCKLLSKARRAPRYDEGQGGSQQEHLWNAARSLKIFTLRELFFAATTDDVKIDRKSAERYLRLLRDAGYFAVEITPRPRTETWRLKVAMNSGPLPPLPLEVTMLWDCNSRKLINPPTEAVERKP